MSELEQLVAENAALRADRDALLAAIEEAYEHCFTCRRVILAGRRCDRCQTFAALIAKAKGGAS